MEAVFRRYEATIEPPGKVNRGGGFEFRYRESSLENAIVQKVARLVSAPHAAEVLLQAGLLQDQGTIHRGIDEINEDILFLVLGITAGKTEVHERYLVAFNAERLAREPEWTQKPSRTKTIQRSEITSHNERVVGGGRQANFSGALIYKAYSGYVHASSQNIMDMVFDGQPPKFQIRVQPNSRRTAEAEQNSWNHLYRSLVAFIYVAKGFATPKHSACLRHVAKNLIFHSGTLQTQKAHDGPDRVLPLVHRRRADRQAPADSIRDDARAGGRALPWRRAQPEHARGSRPARTRPGARERQAAG